MPASWRLFFASLRQKAVLVVFRYSLYVSFIAYDSDNDELLKLSGIFLTCCKTDEPTESGLILYGGVVFTDIFSLY